MKPFLLILFFALLLSFTSLQQNNNKEVTNNQSNICSPELKCPAPQSFARTINSDNAKQSSENSGSDIDQSWYQKAMEQIEKDEYNISYSEELGAYQSPNRANNIRFIYHKDGFTAKTRSTRIPKFDVNDKTLREEEKEYDKVEDWSVKLKVESGEWKMESGEWRVESGELRMESEKLQASGNKAWIENDEMRIDYTNTKEGMRQDFIIKEKPPGEESSD